MPGLDRTGPEGQGSRTGRGMGKCNPANRESNTDENQPSQGLGMGRGRRCGGQKGRGRGLGRNQ